jgi:hypothetical protein
MLALAVHALAEHLLDAWQTITFPAAAEVQVFAAHVPLIIAVLGLQRRPAITIRLSADALSQLEAHQIHMAVFLGVK